MTTGSRRASVLLFVGDLLVFVFSLWLTLLVRYGQIPSRVLLNAHAGPFAFLFIVWLLVFYMGGLYEKRAVLFKRDLSGRLIRTQIFNIVIAALFFFFIPALGITPKTNLFIYFVISLALILLWRLVLSPRITTRRTRDEAVIIGAGPEVDELAAELRGNSRYALYCEEVIDPAQVSHELFAAALDRAEARHVRLLIVDTRDADVAPFVPLIYQRAFERGSYEIVDLLALYEEVFDRVPLTLLGYEWFFRYATRRVSGAYLLAKRITDIAGGLVMGAVTIIATPFVWIAMRLEGPGPLFIEQNRIGEHETCVRSYKFRSMRMNKSASSDWTVDEKDENPVTRVGAFLRLTSLDEFPQFINILAGELSLVGPRNDIEGLGKRLAEALPYYRVRYLVKPGITGWAQVNQQYEQGNISPQSIEETKMRLAYDFYYLKHRSFVLDMTIALKTVKRMLFRLAS
ncbi:MAG TPA: sugar transferase [Candidatus Paceibacterota bacterium]|nr:sugar transferase [Candidatus Paceibacterota bacterium]